MQIYWEKSGSVLLEGGIMQPIISYSKENTRVENSYLIKSRLKISRAVSNIIKERERLGLPVTRDKKSYIREWVAHNRLYKLGLFKSHTKDVDMEEPIKWYYELIYWLIGGLK